MKPIATVFYGVEQSHGCENVQDMLLYLGDNTGNLLFRYALQKRIVDLSAYELVTLPAGLDLFSRLDAETCRKVLSSALVIYPVANLLRSREQYEAIGQIQNETRFLTQLCDLFSCPILVMGLGFQGRLESQGKRLPELHPAQIELVHRLLEHSGFITVRGQHTRALLRQTPSLRHALIESLGCPSLMISSDHQHGAMVAGLAAERQRKVGLERIALGLPSNKLGDAVLMKRLARLAEDPRVHVVLQDLTDLEACRQLGLPQERLHMFCDLDAWVAFLRGCDLCISARIHGSQVAMLAMTPFLLIATDSRIEELAQQMALPCIRSDDPELAPLLADPLRAQRRALAFDGEAYDRNRQQLARATVRLLEFSGLPPHPDLLALAGRAGEVTEPPQTVASPLARIDVRDYLERHPEDPFLATQNPLGIAFHAVTTGLDWRAFPEDQPLQERPVVDEPVQGHLDAVLRISDRHLVLVGWCSDLADSASLSLAEPNGPAMSLPLGPVRIRRPDVQEALEWCSGRRPDFGFFRIVERSVDATPLQLTIGAEVFSLEELDLREEGYQVVAERLLDSCQWFHTPVTRIDGLMERDLGEAFRVLWQRRRAAPAGDPDVQLQSLQQLQPDQTVLLVCLNSTVMARLQLDRLRRYPSVQSGGVRRVVAVQDGVSCCYSGCLLFDLMRDLLASLPSALLVRKGPETRWSQMVRQVRRWSTAERFAFLGPGVLTSSSDWLAAMAAGLSELPPGLFDGGRPPLQTALGQPVDRMDAYLLLGSETSDAASANCCEISSAPLVTLASGYETPSLPSQSRPFWQQAVEALLGG